MACTTKASNLPSALLRYKRARSVVFHRTWPLANGGYSGVTDSLASATRTTGALAVEIAI